MTEHQANAVAMHLRRAAERVEENHIPVVVMRDAIKRTITNDAHVLAARAWLDALPTPILDVGEMQRALDAAAAEAPGDGRFTNWHNTGVEVWWIYSPVNGAPWAGLRIAFFHRTADGVEIAVICSEPPDRAGPRIWGDIMKREHWYKVKQIPIPSTADVLAGALLPINEPDGL